MERIMGEFFEMQEDGLLDSRGEYRNGRHRRLNFKFNCGTCRRGFGTQQAINDHNRVKHNKETK